MNAVVAHTLGPDPAVVVQSQSPGVAHQHLVQPVHAPDPEVTVVIRKAMEESHFYPGKISIHFTVILRGNLRTKKIDWQKIDEYFVSSNKNGTEN